MTFALTSVQQTDCVLSQRPLVLGRQPGKYVYGARAVLQAILYRWYLPAGVLPYDPTFGEGLCLLLGATLSPRQILGLRGRLEAAARAEDFVASASVPVELVGTSLAVPGAIKLVDGSIQPLELTLSSAGAALDALGL